jgi:muramidase (phage lysozyme)
MPQAPNQLVRHRPTVQDTEGNDENGYSVTDPNKTETDYSKEPNQAHKTTLKEEIL